eukprot:TRINITY_DN875_c0_g2_i1.p1 TRINITY_DN875_c0_g2~~TRINITY_DN875_c0_g2_i1.p1  ORF type:complete len:356 (+),score=74.18 TRINITY_DN875_c0_g2_i1:51-1118(+)
MNFFSKGWDAFNSDPHEAEQAALGDMGAEEYGEKTTEAVPGDIFMFSGCQDSQTSADVSNVSSFGLPPDSGPGGAGGACTNALLATAYAPGEVSWVELLEQMRQFLGGRGYSQIPQLSSSRQIDLSMPFEIAGGYGGARKSLLVGINYVNHSQGVLSGCVNDVVSMKNYICSEGFMEDDTMRILVDEPGDFAIPTDHPSKENIINSIRWLVEDAQPGDVLFFHYSGHGGQQRDTSGDEEDGMDETLIPEDYNSSGVITDDDLFRDLIMGIPVGVRLVCVMDCCHSGSILDLPFMFTASSGTMSAIQEGGAPAQMFANPGFHGQIGKLVKYGMDFVEQHGGADKLLSMASSFGLPF